MPCSPGISVLVVVLAGAALLHTGPASAGPDSYECARATNAYVQARANVNAFIAQANADGHFSAAERRRLNQLDAVFNDAVQWRNRACS